jgi:hypothetical protein
MMKSALPDSFATGMEKMLENDFQLNDFQLVCPES